MIIRRLTTWDIPQIINMSHKYHETVEHMPYEFDAVYVAACLNSYLNKPESGFFVAVEDGNIVGFLWGLATNVLPWTPTLSAIDVVFYVEKKHRGSRAAIKLIKAYESWAKELGCVEALLSTSSGINTERTLGFYERMGFHGTGTQTAKEL